MTTAENSSATQTAEQPELTDGRNVGDVDSRYNLSCWNQIIFELIYLLIVLCLCGWLLLCIGSAVGSCKVYSAPSACLPLPLGFEYPRDRELLIWMSIALSGVTGGAALSLKWLYHSVAKNLWNRDRVVWRFTVPILSGVFAVFVGFMVSSGIIPLLNTKAFDHFYRALGFGFFLGYFSDNVLAKLQRLAVQWFGVASGEVETKEG